MPIPITEEKSIDWVICIEHEVIRFLDHKYSYCQGENQETDINLEANKIFNKLD